MIGPSKLRLGIIVACVLLAGYIAGLVSNPLTSQLSYQNSVLRVELNQQSAQNSLLRAQASQVESENSMMSAQLNQFNSENSQINLRLKALQAELSRLQGQIKSIEEQVSKVSVERDQLMQELASLRFRLDSAGKALHKNQISIVAPRGIVLHDTILLSEGQELAGLLYAEGIIIFQIRDSAGNTVLDAGRVRIFPFNFSFIARTGGYHMVTFENPESPFPVRGLLIFNKVPP